MWSLPPKQRVLSKEQGETTYDLDDVQRDLTIIISTSVGEFTPSTDVVIAALESLQGNLAFRWCKKLLVFDAVPTEQEITQMKQDKPYYEDVVRGFKWEALWNSRRESYTMYGDALRKMKEDNHPALFNVTLHFLPSFGHLLGTLTFGLAHVCTPRVFIHQHDLRLGNFAAADVQGVMELLGTGDARYIILNRDVNSGSRPKKHFTMDPEHDFENEKCSLTAIFGFSDQAHFADTEWYLSEVVGKIPDSQKFTCMEHVLHDDWKLDPFFKRTYLYGGKDDGPYVYDLVHGMQIKDSAGRIQGIPSMPARALPM